MEYRTIKQYKNIIVVHNKDYKWVVFDNEALPMFAKKETLRIIPHQFLTRQHDTVQLTYP